MNINTQQPSSYIAHNVSFPSSNTTKYGFYKIISKVLVEEMDKKEVLVEAMIMILVIISLIETES